MISSRVSPLVLVLAGGLALRTLASALWVVPGATLFASVAGTLVAGAVVVVRRDALRSLPGRWAWALFAVLVGVAALRAPDVGTALHQGMRLLSLPLWFAAAWAAIASDPDRRALLWVASIAAGCTAAASLGALAVGHLSDPLHGLPRLVFPHQHLHDQALLMALVALLGADRMLRPEEGRLLGGILFAGGVAALWASYVRTGMVGLFLALAVLLLLRGRVGGLAGLVAGAGIVLLASDTLRDRFSDVAALVTMSEPPGGWDSLGSSRWELWHRSASVFWQQPILVRVLGTGLGNLLPYWKDDPHQDYLWLTYQLGPLGAASYVGAQLALLGALVRSRNRGALDAELALAILAMSVSTSLLSNAFVVRIVPAWIAWATIGAVLAPSRREGQGGPPKES